MFNILAFLENRLNDFENIIKPTHICYERPCETNKKMLLYVSYT